MRKGKSQRKRAGILTTVQIAVEFDLPLGLVRQAVQRAFEDGQLQFVYAKTRRYVRRADAMRLFGQPEGNAAA